MHALPKQQFFILLKTNSTKFVPSRSLFFFEFLDFIAKRKEIINKGKPEVPWTVTADGEIR